MLMRLVCLICKCDHHQQILSRTYKFYTGQAVFGFGHGLSYTTFNYSWYNDSIASIESLSKNFCKLLAFSNLTNENYCRVNFFFRYGRISDTSYERNTEL
jgi:hypothetical protein